MLSTKNKRNTKVVPFNGVTHASRDSCKMSSSDFYNDTSVFTFGQGEFYVFFSLMTCSKTLRFLLCSSKMLHLHLKWFITCVKMQGYWGKKKLSIGMIIFLALRFLKQGRNIFVGPVNPTLISAFWINTKKPAQEQQNMESGSHYSASTAGFI